MSTLVTGFVDSKGHSRNQISLQRAQMDAQTAEISNHAENRDLLLQVLANQEELKRVVTLHRAGDPVAEEIMQEGQEVTNLYSSSLLVTLMVLP